MSIGSLYSTLKVVTKALDINQKRLPFKTITIRSGYSYGAVPIEYDHVTTQVASRDKLRRHVKMHAKPNVEY